MENIKNLKTRRGDLFKSIQLQLLDKTIELVIWPDILRKTEELWIQGDFVSIIATQRERNGITSLSVEKASVYNFSKNHDPSAYEENTHKEDKIYIEKSPNPSINDKVIENPSKEKINIKSLLIKMFETNDAENSKKTVEDIFILMEDSPGTSEVNLHVKSKDKIIKILLPKKVEINKILTERLIEVVGEDNVSTIR